MDEFLVRYLVILTVHWFADFVCQTNWQSRNKSKSWRALTQHVLTYGAVLAVGSVFLLPAGGSTDPAVQKALLQFIGLNTVLHFATDSVTSRMTASLYAKQDWHNFFVVVGFDQLIHQVTLGLTMMYFLG